MSIILTVVLAQDRAKEKQIRARRSTAGLKQGSRAQSNLGMRIAPAASVSLVWTPISWLHVVMHRVNFIVHGLMHA